MRKKRRGGEGREKKGREEKRKGVVRVGEGGSGGSLTLGLWLPHWEKCQIELCCKGEGGGGQKDGK